MSKKKNTLLRNTSILMAATIISRVIGLLYRSPLGETIGNEGLGYYSTASNLYTILLLISSYSIPMAVSKIVSERLALKEYRNAPRLPRCPDLCGNCRRNRCTGGIFRRKIPSAV